MVLCLSSGIMASGALTSQYDWTGRIENASFESGTASWKLTQSTSGWNDVSIVSGSAADGDKHYNIWAQNVTSLDLSQVVTLPAGEYTLSAQLRTNSAGLSDQHVYASSPEGLVASPALTSSSDSKWTTLTLTFTLREEEDVTIGAASTGSGNSERGWFCIDNFRMTGSTEPPADHSQTLAQVTASINISGNDELHVTGTVPFATGGSVNFEGTEHAVVFFDNMRPSAVLPHLSHVYVRGSQAVNGKNCQLRLHDHGTLLYPYGKEDKGEDGFHPLTVFSEQNCRGESCSLFGIENTKGFMNSLDESTLNNRIRSFRLKRGYMVTFSIGFEGYGYQRCYIADDADLIVNTLPAMLDRRISSYRVFRWNNIGKNGVANILNTDRLGILNATWTYAWGVGNELGMDYECVPHMNHLWAATTYQLGVNNQSPYLKTDNEPANGNDNHPATVAQELERWPELMRTGRRLISPSSFDSGEWWHQAFLDSIDARGWRCDIVDIHCYWNEGSFNNIKGSWADKFHRPVWITEFIWGASWSGGFGIFGLAKTNEERNNPSDEVLQKNREVLTRIWDKLNNYEYVERYAYWNDEWPCSKILIGNSLTPAGKQFSTMKTGTSYAGTYDFVPTEWRLTAPKDLAAEYNSKTGTCHVTWTSLDCDLSGTVTLLRSIDGGAWESVATWDKPDFVNFEYTDTIRGEGVFTYRVKNKTYKNSILYSGTASVCRSKSHGTAELQYGHIKSDNSNAITIPYLQSEGKPIVFSGMTTNENRSFGIVPVITKVAKDNFTFCFEPWSIPEGSVMTEPETADFLAIRPGRYQWGSMTAEVDTCWYIKDDGTRSKLSHGDSIHVTFRQPFPNGIIPVVIVQPMTTTTSSALATPQIMCVTNEGFDMKLMKQVGDSRNIAATTTCYYIAVTPGSANLNEANTSIHAGRFGTAIGGLIMQTCRFLAPDSSSICFREPYVLAASQNHLLDYTNLIRLDRYITEVIDGETMVVGAKLRRQMDSSASITGNSATRNGSTVGWIAISKNGVDVPDGITAKPEQPKSAVQDIYSLSGQRVSSPSRGSIYIINGKKILIR